MPSARRAASPCTSPIARCSAISATRSATISGTGWCATAASSSRSARCSATNAPTTARPCNATTSRARRPTGSRASSRLRHHASVGGLRRDLGALPAHRRHARDRRAPSACRPGRAVTQGDELDASVDFDPYRAPGIRPADRELAAAHRRPQQPEPRDGPARPLPVRAVTAAIDKLGFVHELVHAAEPLGGRSQRGPAHRGQQ